MLTCKPFGTIGFYQLVRRTIPTNFVADAARSSAGCRGAQAANKPMVDLTKRTTSDSGLCGQVEFLAKASAE